MCEPGGRTPALLQFRSPAPALPPPALAALCDPLYSWTVPVRSLSFQLLLSTSGLSRLCPRPRAGS